MKEPDSDYDPDFSLAYFCMKAICILNTEGCNLVANLGDDEYTKFLDLMRHIILGEQ